MYTTKNDQIELISINNTIHSNPTQLFMYMYTNYKYYNIVPIGEQLFQ